MAGDDLAHRETVLVLQDHNQTTRQQEAGCAYLLCSLWEPPFESAEEPQDTGALQD